MSSSDSYVEILTPCASKYDCMWGQVFKDEEGMNGAVRRALIQSG